MTSNKLKAREGGSYTSRETEVFEITEERWRGAWATPDVNNGELTAVHFPVETKMDNFITEKVIMFGTIDGQLYGGVRLAMAEGVDTEALAGGWTVSLRRPGASPFSKLEGDLDDLKKIRSNFFARHKRVLERNYGTERFLKEYLIDGSLVVELVTGLRVGRSAAVKDELAKSYIADVRKFFTTSPDMVVECEGVSMPASRALLSARSPTLAAALGPNWESEGRWPVTGAGPAATRAMLDFLQGGEIPGREKMEVMARDLLHLATFYQLPDLQEAAKRALLRGLTVDTAVATLVMFDQHVSGDVAAKDEVLAFIKRNAREVVKGEDWELFVKRFPGLVIEVDLAMAPAE